MPIQIIDNFELTTTKPLDNRLVVGTSSFYKNKDDIQNKYSGLRIWELPGSLLTGGGTNNTSTGLGYVWTGSSWISENTTAISGGGTTNTVPVFNTSNSIQSSPIWVIGGAKVGIGTSASNNSHALNVNGNLNATSFSGNGSNITNLNAANLTGTINISRLPGSTTGWILTADNASSASYKNPSSITVGTASQVSISNDNSSSDRYITFVDQSSNGSRQIRTTDKVFIIPSSGIIKSNGLRLATLNSHEITSIGNLSIKTENHGNSISISTQDINFQSFNSGDISISPGNSTGGTNGVIKLNRRVQLFQQDSNLTILSNRPVNSGIIGSLSGNNNINWIRRSTTGVAFTTTWDASSTRFNSENYDRIISVSMPRGWNSSPDNQFWIKDIFICLSSNTSINIEPGQAGHPWTRIDKNYQLIDGSVYSFIVPANNVFCISLQSITNANVSYTTTQNVTVSFRRLGI